MVIIPSLSLWSTFKIPFSLYSKKITPPIPYVDSCKDLKQKNYNREAKTAPEVVNLRVPSPLSKIEESSGSSLHLQALSISHKKRTYRKCSGKYKPKQIGYVIVPSGAFLDKSNDWEEIFSNCEKAIANSTRSRETCFGEDLNEKFPDFDLERVCGEYDYIPSVKPWLQEELDEINRVSNSQEAKTLKMIKDKKQKNMQKENSTLTNIKSTDNKKIKILRVPFFEDFYGNPSKKLQRFTTKMKEMSGNPNSYQSKLTELYLKHK